MRSIPVVLDDLEVAIDCFFCHQPLTLLVTPGRHEDNIWHCVDCAAGHRVRLQGTIRAVVKRPTELRS